jgi:hypothetical protein
VSTGTILSGIGHAALILWVILGDWLFAAQDTPEIAVTTMTMMTSAEFDAMKAAVASPPRPQAKPRVETPPVEVATPEPVIPDTPEPPPEPEPQPEPEPVPEVPPEPAPDPQPIEVPEPIVPLAPEEQILPSVSPEVQPEAQAADIVSPEPTPEPEPDIETATDPTEATSDVPTEDPVVVPEDTNQTVAAETGDVIETEANQDQTEALGMQTSLRPKSRPARPEPDVVAEDPPPEPAAEDTAQTDADVQDALEAALNEVVDEPASEAGTEDIASPAGGDPMSEGEIGDFSRAIGNKWNLGSASTDALRTTIVIRVTFGPDATPQDFELIQSDGPTDAATQTAFEAARRAIIRASGDGGIPLPLDKYDTWKVLELEFNPNGMRLR